MDNTFLLIIITKMFQNIAIANAVHPVFWVDFFNKNLDRIFVEGFFVLAPNLQYLVRKFFVEFLVQNEFGNLERIVLRQTIVEMSEDEFLKHIEKNIVSLLSLADESNLDYIPPCVDGLSSDNIAVNSKNSMDEYLDYIKETTGAVMTSLEYLKRLGLLVQANFWLMHYFQVKESVDEASKINFEWFDEESKKKVRIYKPFYGNQKLKYMKRLKHFTMYSKFLQRNPEFLVKSVKSLHEELKKISEKKKEDPCKRNIEPLVIKEPVPKPLDLSGIDFDKLIDFILSCMNIEEPHAMLPPVEALKKVQDDRNDIRNLLLLTIVSILSSTFTKSSSCEIADQVFNQHVMVALKDGHNLDRCQMSRTRVHYDQTNCSACRGCDVIHTVEKYGECGKLAATGFQRILHFTCLGEYNSFFSFVMFICQINRRYCYSTKAPKEFEEIQKFLKLLLSLHSHYMPDLHVLADRYNFSYHKQHVLYMSCTVDDLLSHFGITMEQCHMLEILNEEENLGASTRRTQSQQREDHVLQSRWNDEDATGLPWNHRQVLHVLTGGTRY